MARYQPPGRRGTQPRGMLPARQLPPPDPALRQRAVAAFALGVLSLLGLALGLGNLRRGVFVAVLTLVFAVVAIWLGVSTNRGARRGGTARPRAQRVVAADTGGVLAAAEHVLQLHEQREYGDRPAGLPHSVQQLGRRRDQRTERPVTPRPGLLPRRPRGSGRSGDRHRRLPRR